MQDAKEKAANQDDGKRIRQSIEAIYYYMNKAKERGIWGCEVTPDEMRMALVALADLERQGILSDPEVDGYKQIKTIVRAAVAKSAECAEVFDEAWDEFWKKGGPNENTRI